MGEASGRREHLAAVAATEAAHPDVRLSRGGLSRPPLNANSGKWQSTRLSGRGLSELSRPRCLADVTHVVNAIAIGVLCPHGSAVPAHGRKHYRIGQRQLMRNPEVAAANPITNSIQDDDSALTQMHHRLQCRILAASLQHALEYLNQADPRHEQALGVRGRLGKEADVGATGEEFERRWICPPRPLAVLHIAPGNLPERNAQIVIAVPYGQSSPRTSRSKRAFWP